MTVGWQAANSSATVSTRASITGKLLAAKTPKLLGDRVGNAIALEPAPQHLVDGAADVEIELDRKAAIDIGIGTAQMDSDLCIAARS